MSNKSRSALSQARSAGLASTASNLPGPATSFKRNVLCAIYRLGPGQPSIEGYAKVLEEDAFDIRNLAWVRFKGEDIARLRFVFPDWQKNPQRTLANLQALWRASLTPEILIGELLFGQDDAPLRTSASSPMASKRRRKAEFSGRSRPVTSTSIASGELP